MVVTVTERAMLPNAYTCRCCGGRAARRLVRLPSDGRYPVLVAVCPRCDTTTEHLTVPGVWRGSRS